MIDLKKFEKTKTTKPAGELTPNDVGSLVKVISVDGSEVSDIHVAFYAGDFYRNRRGPDHGNIVSLSFEHMGVYRDQFDGGRGSVDVNPGMRVVVQRPISEQ